MSIDPVIAIFEGAVHSAESTVGAIRPQHVRAQPNPVQSISGTEPNSKSAAAGKETKAPESSDDEVQVQRDGQNQIVIKYLDSAGKVIFQVPSSQILALQQSIEEALDEEAQSRMKGNGRPGTGAGGIGHEH